MKNEYFESPGDMHSKALDYIVYCNELSCPPTLAGFASFSDIPSTVIKAFRNGDYDEGETKGGFSAVVIKLMDYIENDRLINGLKNRYNGAVVVLDLKSNHDYKEKSGLDLSYESKQPIIIDDVPKLANASTTLSVVVDEQGNEV